MACAASGTVHGVPVQRLREDDAIGSLDLSDSSLGVFSAELLGLMLPAATSLHEFRCGTAPFPENPRERRFRPPSRRKPRVRPCPKANTLWHASMTPLAPVTHSVGKNEITGDAADQLANVVLEHATMTEFCGIPLASLRENSITRLNLRGGGGVGVGVPGAIVLSKLLPCATALTSLRCTCRPTSACICVSAH